MTRILLRHLSGSKNQQIDEIPLDKAKDLLIGRDPAAAVRFDPEKDDLVGRQHARILQDPGDPFRFSIVDLNSRNGTFLNQQRVVGTAVLTSGDVVQLGPGGPEFRFEIDPLPAGMAKATRLSPAAGAPMATREAAMAPPMPGAGQKVGVGKETIERMVGQAKQESRKNTGMVAGVLLLLLIVVAGVGYWWWDKNEKERIAKLPWTTEKLSATYAPTTVYIEMSWKLVGQTGEAIYQDYATQTDDKGQKGPAMPVFEKLADGSIVPSLTLDTNGNKPISCAGTGSGFVVTSDGFIMTNRHVAANWKSRYGCFPDSGAAVVIVPGQKQPVIVPDISALGVDWVPALDSRRVAGRPFEGQNIVLDVTFKLNKLRFPATVVRISDRADVALIKISTPQPVQRVELPKDPNAVVPVGANITVMGYPGISPKILVETLSLDPIARERRQVIVPDTTVTPGAIGRVLSSQMTATQGLPGSYASEIGDAYQLTVNATGAGNSGGPVFDDHGMVIGIFTLSKVESGTMITFAVPIRYGMELMGTSPAVTTGGGK